MRPRSMRHRALAVPLCSLIVVLLATPALACGGLVAPNGSVNLLRTATLAAYQDGIEHYVTSFEFAGGGAEFGSIIPLPGIPTSVKRGGSWTLQRLQEEVAPPTVARNSVALAGTSFDRAAKVILEKEIDALDITILEGGGDAVGKWAEENGFGLTPDAPEILDFYAERSPIFMAARFDLRRARALGQGVGDGTPIHLAIPTQNPWVPLRILGLGRQPNEIIEADVFLLTESEPTLLPAPGTPELGRGIELARSEPASSDLLTDLRSDKGMKWLADEGLHLSYLRIDARADEVSHDLAIDASGTGVPSRISAGLDSPPSPRWPQPTQVPWGLWAGAVVMGAAVLLFLGRGASSEWN